MSAPSKALFHSLLLKNPHMRRLVSGHEPEKALRLKRVKGVTLPSCPPLGVHAVLRPDMGKLRYQLRSWSHELHSRGFKSHPKTSLKNEYAYTYVYACIHVYMCACLHIYTYAHILIHTYMHTYTHIHIYTYTHIYKYTCMVSPPPPPKIDHFQCFISGDTSQNLQGLGLLASQLHLASAFWLHRMNMLKKPEEIKKIKQIKTIRVLRENAQVRISESE